MSTYLVIAARMATVAVAFGAFTSCATLTRDQCASVNWNELGHKDGEEGRAQSHLERHLSACAEHNLPVDQTQWIAGWEQGIRLYCTPENGLLQGREGRYYANSCSGELKTDFESAYSVGKRLHDARAARDTQQRELDSLMEKRRVAETTADKERLDREIRAKRSSLRLAERHVWDAESDYELYITTRRLSRF